MLRDAQGAPSLSTPEHTEHSAPAKTLLLAPEHSRHVPSAMTTGSAWAQLVLLIPQHCRCFRGASLLVDGLGLLKSFVPMPITPGSNRRESVRISATPINHNQGSSLKHKNESIDSQKSFY